MAKDELESINNEKIEKSNNEVVTSGSIIKSMPAWLWALVVGGSFFALLGLFVVLSSLVRGFFGDGVYSNQRFGERGYMRNEYASNRFGSYNDGRSGGMYRMDKYDTSSSSRVSGVVTAVDNETITVAGNGLTKKIKITSSTQFNGDTKPAKINDSIVAFGALDNDTLTATSVILSRQ